MGCFLACLGISNKRNTRKRVHKRHGSYEALDSHSPLTILTLDNETDSEPRHKSKNQLGSLIRKKVSFNLNVQVYEPISTEYHLLSDQENEAKTTQKENEEQGQRSLLSSQSSSSNYRYQNCRDFYDEEDGIVFEDGDLDEYEDDYDFVDAVGESDIDSLSESEDGILNRKVSSDELIEEEALVADKSQYTHSVLKPVENLSQWRVAKAKEAVPAKQHKSMKENVSLLQDSQIPALVPNCNQPNLLQREISVDSSLSSWINSSSI